MAQLNDNVFGTFHRNVRGQDIMFIADAIEVARKRSDGKYFVEHYSCMDSFGGHWTCDWSYFNGDFHTDGSIHGLEELYDIVEKAVQIVGSIDGRTSFTVKFTKKDYIKEAEG